MLGGQYLRAYHGVGFTGAGLPIGKDSDKSRLEDFGDEGSYRVPVDLGGVFILGEGVVKLEVLVIEELGDTVDLGLGVVDHYVRVSTRHHV